MKSGMLPKTAKQAADELIAGTEKDPTRMASLPDADPAGAPPRRARAGRGVTPATDAARLGQPSRNPQSGDEL